MWLTTNFFIFFYFFIKCMQPMTMTLSRRCMYAKLHVTWPKSLLYIFSLVNHIDSLRIQALSLNPRHRTPVFLCPFAFFAFYSSVPNSHFLVAIRVFFKYSSVAILPILVMNSVNIVSVFLSWAFSLSFICSACSSAVNASTFASHCIFHSICSNYPLIIDANSSWNSHVPFSAE